jgi:hypothetical protein
MATVTKSQGKTGFVKQFLSEHPEGTSKTVNEAWQAAGFDGTISHPIVSEVRKQLGLTGNLPGKTRKAAKGKSAPSLRKTVARDQGKTTFVKEFLGENPQGNVQAVNEAWTKAGKDGSIGATLIQKVRSQMGLTGNLRATSKPKTAGTAAGFEGTISRTLVDKSRALLGLTGNLRGKTKKTRTSATGKKLGRPRKETTAAVSGQPRGRKSARTLALTELEADIDRLIFKVMGIGDLTQIEDTLRQARRVLYGALTRG